jgi:hypothetical protein
MAQNMDITELFNKKDFTPNPSKILDNMKYGGIDVNGCILELVDNMIDAGAENGYIYTCEDDGQNLQSFYAYDDG